MVTDRCWATRRPLGHTGSATAWEVLGIRPCNRLARSLCDEIAGLRKGNGRLSNELISAEPRQGTS